MPMPPEACNPAPIYRQPGDALQQLGGARSLPQEISR